MDNAGLISPYYRGIRIYNGDMIWEYLGCVWQDIWDVVAHVGNDGTPKPPQYGEAEMGMGVPWIPWFGFPIISMGIMEICGDIPGKQGLEDQFPLNIGDFQGLCLFNRG